MQSKVIIIALDIDGVLNAYGSPHLNYTNRTPDMGLDKVKIALLNQSIEGFDVKFVLSSSWRIRGVESVSISLAEMGFKGTFIGRTGSIEMKTPEEDGRGKKIRLWKEQYEKENPDTEVVVIVVDDEIEAARHARARDWPYIFCNGKTGFDEKDAYKLREILEELTT